MGIYVDPALDMSTPDLFDFILAIIAIMYSLSDY